MDNFKSEEVETDFLSLMSQIQKSITKTNNNKIRDAYLKVYQKIKALKEKVQKMDIHSEVLNELERITLIEDPNADGMFIQVSFNENADSSKFHQFKIAKDHGK